MSTIKQRYQENENFRLFVQILAIFIISRLFFAVCVPIYNGVAGTSRTFSFLMNEWDAEHYRFMIDNGYTFPTDLDPQANWAFFPLYMLVCMGVKFITFGVINTYWIGMIVSNICIFIASFFSVKILKKMNLINGDEGLLLPVFMLAGPYAFYSSSTYTEAMFIMFIVLFFYFVISDQSTNGNLSKNRSRDFFMAGLMAAGASGTRIVGCTLVFALLVEMYLHYVGEKPVLSWKNIGGFIKYLFMTPQRIVALFLCPFGTFAYMFFLKFFCGDVWAFKNVQIAWRTDTFFPIIGVMWKACTGQIEPRYTYMGWVCVAVFAVYGYMFYRKLYSMAIFGVIALLIPLTSHVMSTCRFIVGTFVVFVGLYDILRRSKKQVRWIVLALMAAWEIWLIFMWYNSSCWMM